MEQVKLNNDLMMPILGFGVFQIPDPKVCEESVAAALRTGYRLIDTAAVYGNEEAVGRAVKRSGIPRGEVFLTSKLWIRDQGYEPARKAFGELSAGLGRITSISILSTSRSAITTVHGGLWRSFMTKAA